MIFLLTKVTNGVTNLSMENFGELYEDILKSLKRYEQGSLEEEKSKFKKSLAVKVRAYRIKHNLTQEELAKKLDVPRMQVIRWESAKHMPGKTARKKLISLKILE